MGARRVTPPSDVRGALVAFGVAAVIAVAGWRLMWFLTDDAYISFRYVSNWLLGHGLTWNPPPFQPVEGYSNFLWVVVLALAWVTTGVAPPDAANWLSLALGLGTLGLAAHWLWRGLDGEPGRWRVALFALALLALVTNRTYLTWLSSGLETALMNALVLWWLYESTRAGRLGAVALPRLCLAAALLALTRPDGLGFWVATGVIAAIVWRFGPPAEARRAVAFRSLAALLVPMAHLLWRRATYGDWLPNTYYAKVIAPWPEMGLRYLASFVIEHGVWVWLLAMGVAAGLWLRRGGMAEARSRWVEVVAPTLAIATLVAQVAYYVLFVGGDHFEYRVFSHLVPLLVIALVFALRSTGWTPQGQAAVLAAFWLVGLAIPWVHWWHSHQLETREETFSMRVPVAPHFPPGARAAVAWWDELQAEMIVALVGTRHQEHKIFHRFQVAAHPPREEGARLPWSERHSLLAATVGVPGWTLPHVAVIDALGLNDRVIARAPLDISKRNRRDMAHDRRGDSRYLHCFLPDVGYRAPTAEEKRTPLGPDVVPGSMRRFVMVPREKPLTDERIRECETRDWY